MPRILVVEDDRVSARLFEAILSRLGGFEVQISEAADEVVRLTSEGEVDLLLVDASFSEETQDGPPVSGVDISRRIKQSSAHVPVVLSQWGGMTAEHEQILAESGADEYLSKPIVDHVELVERIHALFGRLSGTTERTKQPSEPATL